MRILMLSQWFQPEPIMAGLPLAAALRDRGHEIEVLTGIPNYPGGAVYPGYSIRPWTREVIDGIPVTRLLLYPSHDRSGIRRIANYLSFSACASTLGPMLVRRPDVVLVYNLVTLGLPARILRRLHGARIVLNVQDLWPDSVTASGMLRNRLALRTLERWTGAEYAAADHLMVLSPGMKEELMGRGIPGDRISVVYNWCDEQELSQQPYDEQLAAELGFSGRFNVLFAGTMGVLQGLECVMEAARSLRTAAPDVLFTFIGDGVAREQLQTASRDLDNVQFLPARPMSEIGRVLAQADALLVHLQDRPLFRSTIPSKIQAYMYAGKPILCGVRGDAASLVGAAGAGIAFQPEDPAALVAAVVQMRSANRAELDAMGARGRRYYDEHLSLRRAAARVERVLAGPA